MAKKKPRPAVAGNLKVDIQAGPKPKVIYATINDAVTEFTPREARRIAAKLISQAEYLEERGV